MTMVGWSGSFKEDGTVNKDEMIERLMLLIAGMTKRLGGEVHMPFAELQPSQTAALLIEGDIPNQEVVVRVTTTREVAEA
jgi:hypothetical protein